ncbi:carboxyltransferase subunit alpha [Paucilactobacillus kaifaensis]|uniref:carboxyltransferase subunit alpha n=1 Tax=Paucilactobacillus kaifaensis TaxID=2559921 RepID=UPI001CC3F1A8|nr:carboxyltransferase subunit alpha [Paucilactobacillus kaifaensis]
MLKQQLQQIRNQDRISSQAVLSYLFTDFIELHGDRVLGDDGTLTGGIAFLEGLPVTVLAVNRRTITLSKEIVNGGMVTVSGYKKAHRLIQAAQRFDRPVISLIDMPGADASVYSEQHGQSQAIADVIADMGELTSPNIAIFLGEGHSGGALAFANSNRILMLEQALFSVASPEAVSAIVTGDDLNQYLPMTASALAEVGLVDDIIKEDQNVLQNIKSALLRQLTPLQKEAGSELIELRQHKFLKVLDLF